MNALFAGLVIATLIGGAVQSIAKLARFDVPVTGERIRISSQKTPAVPAPPSVHVVDTLCDPAPLKSSVELGPVAPSLRIQRYVTDAALLLVIVPLKLNVTGQSSPVWLIGVTLAVAVIDVVVTGFDGLEGLLVPTLFVAVTVKV